MQERHLLTMLLLLWITSMATAAWSQQDEVLLENDAVTESKAPFESPISIENPVQTPNFAGIYMTTDNTNPAWLLSVHIQNDEIIIIDLNPHLDFLNKLNYLSPTEAEQDITVSTYDRAFRGRLSAIEAGIFYQAYLNPILPLEQRASDYSEQFYELRYSDNGDIDKFFFSITLELAENQSGEQQYKMALFRNTHLFTELKGFYSKLF